MWTYEVLATTPNVPVMADLGDPEIETPSRRGSVFRIVFPRGYTMNPRAYEPAVGKLCRVVRTSEDGRSEQCDGTINRVTPNVEVTLNGSGFEPV